MSKIYNLYENDLDKAWYKSSNVKYSECDDIDNSLKTVRVVFNNGSQYEYENVNVNDYLLFREAESQGKAFNRYLRKYDYKKLDQVNVKEIDELLDKLIHKDDDANVLLYENTKEGFKLMTRNGDVIYEANRQCSEDEVSIASEVLSAVGYRMDLKEEEE